MLSGCSFWKKSNTPCPPGCLPVMSDVQAGGVSGGMIERRVARVPRVISSPTQGMIPRSTYGSSTVKVAPSRPMTSVGPISGLLEDRFAVLAHEGDELGDGEVALLDGPLSDRVEELGE